MIRISGYPIGNLYFHEYQITKVYAGQQQVYPDHVVGQTFWLKVTKSDNSIVYCWCRQIAKIEDSQGNITELSYEVIQTQSVEPGEGYYELLQEIYTGQNTSGVDYTDCWETKDKTQDEVYDLIPEMNQKIADNGNSVILYGKGVYLQNIGGGSGLDIDLGITVNNYDKFVLTISNMTYTGEALFGCRSVVDSNDFRFFGYNAGRSLYFDCGSRRLSAIFQPNNAQNIFTVYLIGGGLCYVEQDLNNSGTPTVTNLGTSRAFSTFTGTDKELYFSPYRNYSTTESFVFYELKCYSGDQLLNDFVIHPDDLSLSSINRIYDKVNDTFVSLGNSFSLYVNPYPKIQGEQNYFKGNVLNDFSLNPTSQNVVLTKNGERCSFNYKTVLVTDSINEMNYDTNAKYITSYTYYTQDPTIVYDQVNRAVQAYGDGTVKLYVNNNEVSNPYTFTQNASNTTYTVKATAQEEGKIISDTVTQSVTVQGYKTDTPTISYNSNTFVVSASGNGTVLLYVDGTQVSNPYTLYQENTATTYVVTATAQESGKQISDTASKSCTVPAYQAIAPTISFNKHTGVVSASGNGTVILYIDGTQVSNPYTLPDYGTYTATATSQETGRPISDTATLSIEYVEITSEAFINFNKVATSYKTITNVVLDNTTVLTCRYYRTTDGNTASLFGCSDNTGGSWERSVKTCVYRDTHLYFGGAKLSYPVSNNEPHTIVVSYKDGTIEIDGTQVYSGMTISNNTCANFGLSFFYHVGTTAIDATTSNGQYINSFEYKHGNDVYVVQVDNDGLVTHTLNGTVQKSVQTTVDIFA